MIFFFFSAVPSHPTPPAIPPTPPSGIPEPDDMQLTAQSRLLSQFKPPELGGD